MSLEILFYDQPDKEPPPKNTFDQFDEREYLCNAWEGEFSDGKPFELKATDGAIEFKSPYNQSTLEAVLIGWYSTYYSMYLEKIDIYGYQTIFYVSTHEDLRVDAKLLMGGTSTGTKYSADCYIK